VEPQVLGRLRRVDQLVAPEAWAPAERQAAMPEPVEAADLAVHPWAVRLARQVVRRRAAVAELAELLVARPGRVEKAEVAVAERARPRSP